MNSKIMEVGVRIELTLTVLQTVYSPRITPPYKREKGVELSLKFPKGMLLLVKANRTDSKGFQEVLCQTKDACANYRD